jgi:hypothetical protein
MICGGLGFHFSQVVLFGIPRLPRALIQGLVSGFFCLYVCAVGMFYFSSQINDLLAAFWISCVLSWCKESVRSQSAWCFFFQPPGILRVDPITTRILWLSVLWGLLWYENFAAEGLNLKSKPSLKPPRRNHWVYLCGYMLLGDWNVCVEIVVFLVLGVGPAVPWSLFVLGGSTRSRWFLDWALVFLHM